VILALVLAARSLLPPGGPLPELASLEVALGEPSAAGTRGPLPRIEPIDARTALAIAAASWRSGRYADVAAELSDVAPDPLLGAFVDLVHADALFYAGKPAEAIPLFEEVAGGPVPVAAAVAKRRWAEAALAAGQWSEAAEILRSCMQWKGQGSPPLLEELGRALLGGGDRAGAAAAWRAAWLQDPDDSAAQAAHEELSDLEGGAGMFANSPSGLLARAKQLLRTGHPEAAHADLEEAEAVVAAGSKEAERSELELAQAEHALGNDDRALAHWRKAAAASDPVIAATARISLARLLEARGDWKQAVDLLDKVAVARRNKSEGAEAQYLSAWMLLQHGREKDALASFAELAAHPRWSHSEDALWWHAWTQYGDGRLDEAAEELDKLARRVKDGMGPQALYWEARAWTRLRRPAKAADALARLQARAPDSFYVLLAGRAATAPAVAPVEAGCHADPPPGPYLVELRRAALLWALGYGRFVQGELEQAAALAHGPQEVWTVAQVDAALGQAGRAYSLLAGGKAGCAQGGDRRLALYPRPFRAEVERAADAVHIDPLLIWSVMRQESRFRTDARSAAQAAGAMQLLGVTVRRIETIAGVPHAAGASVDRDVAAAAWYLRALSERFHGNPALIAAAYNAGPDAAASWVKLDGARPLDELIERIPFRETRGYVKSVLANYAGYRSLFGTPGRIVDPAKPVHATLPGGVAF
jgi:soluble lytic murein transglycosylase